MLEQSHCHREKIEPIGGTRHRPLWSVMIPTYNCARFLRDTLASVLSQDRGRDLMQIEVVDDCSSRDDPKAVVDELGRGRVTFFRQAENLGVPGNLNACLQRAKGKLVHLLHGDDMLRAGFYSRMEQVFELCPQIGAAFCRHIFVDDLGHQLSISPSEQAQDGVLDNSLQRLATEQRIMTPSIVVRRRVYEELGGFDRRLSCSEDWEMWVRIAARYPIGFVTDPLAVYRMHRDSNTGRHFRTGEDIRYTRQAISIFERYLPPEMAGNITTLARRTYATTALGNAELLLRNNDVTGAAAQLREALKLKRSLRTIQGAFRIVLRSLSMIPSLLLRQNDPSHLPDGE